MGSRRDEIERRFGATADAYASSATHRGGPDLDKMLQLAALRGHENVLDVATGAGNTALAFAERAGRVVALDLAEGMIAKTRERFAEAGLQNGEFVVHDVESLPFEDAAFDIVTCRIAPHHFLHIEKATSEVVRVLRPGGTYLVVDSMAPDDAGVAAFLHEVEARRDPTHVRSLTREEWIAMLQEAGLVVTHVEVFRKRHDFEAWVVRGGTGAEAVAEVRARFAGASDPVRRHLRIESAGDAVATFSDEKVLLAALKPG